MPVTVELRDRLAPWTKQLGWHRPSPAEAAAAVVRRHGWAWKRSCGTISPDFGDEILIIFSILFSTATYNLEYNIIPVPERMIYYLDFCEHPYLSNMLDVGWMLDREG